MHGLRERERDECYVLMAYGDPFMSGILTKWRVKGFDLCSTCFGAALIWWFCSATESKVG